MSSQEQPIGVYDEICAGRDAVLARRTLSPYAVARITGRPVNWPVQTKSVLPSPPAQPKPSPRPRALREPIPYYLTVEGSRALKAAEKMLPDPLPHIPVGTIMRAVCDVAGITFLEMTGTCRRHSISHPRQVAMLLVSELRPDLSFPQIAHLIAGLDHTSVLWGVKQARIRVSTVGPSRSQAQYAEAKAILAKVTV